MMPISFRLKEVLDEANVTPYALAKASGVAPNTVYPIVADRVKRVDLETISRLLGGLRELTGREYDVGDLMRYSRS